jgi:hypothetical protein
MPSDSSVASCWNRASEMCCSYQVRSHWQTCCGLFSSHSLRKSVWMLAGKADIAVDAAAPPFDTVLVLLLWLLEVPLLAVRKVIIVTSDAAPPRAPPMVHFLRLFDCARPDADCSLISPPTCLLNVQIYDVTSCRGQSIDKEPVRYHGDI